MLGVPFWRIAHLLLLSYVPTFGTDATRSKTFFWAVSMLIYKRSNMHDEKKDQCTKYSSMLYHLLDLDCDCRNVTVPETAIFGYTLLQPSELTGMVTGYIRHTMSYAAQLEEFHIQCSVRAIFAITFFIINQFWTLNISLNHSASRTMFGVVPSSTSFSVRLSTAMQASDLAQHFVTALHWSAGLVTFIAYCVWSLKRFSRRRFLQCLRRLKPRFVITISFSPQPVFHKTPRLIMLMLPSGSVELIPSFIVVTDPILKCQGFVVPPQFVVLRFSAHRR